MESGLLLLGASGMNHMAAVAERLYGVCKLIWARDANDTQFQALTALAHEHMKERQPRKKGVLVLDFRGAIISISTCGIPRSPNFRRNTLEGFSAR